MSSTPRFLLILSVQSNTLRASLVNRPLRIVSSAHQTFQVNEEAFDPLEVWYKLKKVIAACFDIGRTLAREIAGLVILTQGDEQVRWLEMGAEVQAWGSLSSSHPLSFEPQAQGSIYQGTMADWFIWNLSGVCPGVSGDLGETRVRAPFDTTLPLLCALTRAETITIQVPDVADENQRALRAAAQVGWQTLDRRIAQIQV